MCFKECLKCMLHDGNTKVCSLHEDRGKGNPQGYLTTFKACTWTIIKGLSFAPVHSYLQDCRP